MADHAMASLFIGGPANNRVAVSRGSVWHVPEPRPTMTNPYVKMHEDEAVPYEPIPVRDYRWMTFVSKHLEVRVRTCELDETTLVALQEVAIPGPQAWAQDAFHAYVKKRRDEARACRSFYQVCMNILEQGDA